MHKFVMAIVVAVSAISVAAASTAHADANDESYLELLTANGLGCGQGAFECPVGDSDMIQIGHSICRQLHGGNSKLSVAQQIIRRMPNVRPDQSVKLVAAAETAYCP